MSQQPEGYRAFRPAMEFETHDVSPLVFAPSGRVTRVSNGSFWRSIEVAGGSQRREADFQMNLDKKRSSLPLM
jgi:hypothetical protein